MPTPTRTNSVARICLLIGMAMWFAEIALATTGRLTIDQFTISMLIPIAIWAYGLFVRWRGSSTASAEHPR